MYPFWSPTVRLLSINRSQYVRGGWNPPGFVTYTDRRIDCRYRLRGGSVRSGSPPGATALGRGNGFTLQITTTNDLSRRIPLVGPTDNEVGHLVQSFNDTLGRLERLIDTQRRFVTDVGHELRTPLTVIKGNVGLMRRMGADEEFFETIESEVDRLTRMVGDLMLLAQAEAGKLPMDRKFVGTSILFCWRFSAR